MVQRSSPSENYFQKLAVSSKSHVYRDWRNAIEICLEFELLSFVRKIARGSLRLFC